MDIQFILIFVTTILDSEVSEACNKNGIAYDATTIIRRLSDWTLSY